MKAILPLAVLACLPLLLQAKPTLEVVLDSSQVKNPFGVAFDEKGTAYVAEFMGGRVHKLTTDGKLTTISGSGEKGFAGDGEDAKKAVNYAKQAGMTVLTYFMFGNLDETLEDMRQTIDFSIELDSDYAEFSITIPYAGTEMYDEALSSGIIDFDYWREFALKPSPNFRPPKLIEVHANIDQMISLRNQSLRRFYFRPRYLLRQIKSVGNFGELFRKTQMGLHLLSGVMNPRSVYIK